MDPQRQVIQCDRLNYHEIQKAIVTAARAWSTVIFV